ncbi:hypothetical protein Anas_09740 [Armadillidium nasatum]|uniref:Uncharacterized protein n=1 Tax=Armadillidium nasatum TaxID=96803 RepID=A0A5N5SP33_9CRUS|nr:hypothetical protein Anas_09740 [Armadillidium nasatum]
MKSSKIENLSRVAKTIPDKRPSLYFCFFKSNQFWDCTGNKLLYIAEVLPILAAFLKYITH